MTSFTNTSFTDRSFKTSGVRIANSMATQQTKQTIQKRKARLIPVSFTFQLTANTIRSIHIQLLNFGHMLRPRGIYTDAIRNSFKLPLTELKQKLNAQAKALTKQSLEEFLESMITESLNDPLWCFRYLNDKIKRLKDGS